MSNRPPLKGLRTTTLAVCFAAVSLGSGSAVAQEMWKPSRTVEFVVGSAPGGSPDVMARMIQSIMQNSGLLSSSTVVNRPGAANTIAWAFLNQQPGDAHYIATYSPAIVGNRIMGTTKLDYRDFTPLNILVREYVTLSVRSDSKIKSLQDLTAMLKKDDQSVTFAFATARGNHNHIVMSMYLNSIGIDPKVAKAVIYPGGGPAVTALLGGHIDVYVSNPRSMYPLQKDGRVRILGISSPKRQPGALAELVPLKEQGIDAEFFTWRGFMSPRGLNKAQLAFWDATFARLAEHEQWLKEAEKQFWNTDYLLSADTFKHIEREEDVMRKILTGLGLAKQ
jgi:putative tricarboxylic transport membrane protein